MLAKMHREDVTCALRKAYGTVAAFETAHDLPAKSVNEVLRGRRWKRVEAAIEKALEESFMPTSEPEYSGSSEASERAHCESAGAR